MDYFDKQDSKNKAHENSNQNIHESYHISKNVFPDNWKVPQDGDFDFVSSYVPFAFLMLMDVMWILLI